MVELAQSQEIKEGKCFAVISYISFLCIVAFISKKNNRFALYHARQGLVLFVFEVVCFILSNVPVFGGIIYLLGLSVALVASLWGIWGAFTGKCYRIPVVSGFAEKIIL